MNKAQICILLTIALLSQALFSQTNVERQIYYISKERAIEIAKCRGYYKTKFRWNANAKLDTVTQTWTIRTWKNKNIIFSFNLKGEFRGDYRVIKKTLILDAISARTKKRNKEKKAVFLKS